MRNNATWKFISGLVILGIGCGMLGPVVEPSAEQGAPEPGEVWRPLSADEMEAVAVDLPQDPAAAAVALVDIIHGGDEAAARAATGELLRRAGLPLVSIEGQVVAAPDVLILGDIPIYVELIDGLTSSTRRHDFYEVADLAELLAALGFSEQPLPVDVLVEALGLWGKADRAPDESVIAGAAVRALSHHRGQVLYAAADPLDIQIDPLQTVLILAHISSRNWVNTQKPVSELWWHRWAGVQTAHAQGAACEALQKLLDTIWDPAKPLPGFEWLHDFNKDTTKNVITSTFETVMEARRPGFSERFGKAMLGHDMLNTAVGILLAWLGAEIKIEANPERIHFHHSEKDHLKTHSTLTATATYRSPISNREIKCYSLAGITVPKEGPLEGWTIRWAIAQPFNHRGQPLVAPVRADLHKLAARGGAGEILDRAGRSTFEIYTASETDPEKGPEMISQVTIVAKLDKPELPFKLADLWDLANPKMFAIKKVFDVLADGIRRAGLPNAQTSIEVEWHGKDIRIAEGTRNIFAFWVDVPLEVTIWTCEGVHGTWQSRVVYRLEPSRLEPILRQAYGSMNLPYPDAPPGFSQAQEEHFQINHHQVNVIPLFTPLQLTGDLRIRDESTMLLTELRRANMVVGEVEMKFSGLSFAAAEELGGSPWKLPIRVLDEHPLCPGSGRKMHSE